jgi:hypothetical protein
VLTTSSLFFVIEQKKGLSKKYYAVMWRWHEEANQYHALGYSSNIIRSVVSMGTHSAHSALARRCRVTLRRWSDD